VAVATLCVLFGVASGFFLHQQQVSGPRKIIRLFRVGRENKGVRRKQKGAEAMAQREKGKGESGKREKGKGRRGEQGRVVRIVLRVTWPPVIGSRLA
jgi:hypothetical protein